ncbi:MAG TPA: M48 family metallopeptidase [Allosphingosinicella sp.]|nr:M48 family metallopeptidase [Allosphingosinicella sp.]
MLKPSLLLAILCLPVAALAAPDPALVALQAMDERVATLGHRLARSNADICPRTMPLSGLLLHGLEQYSARDRASAAATFGLGEELAVLAVIPGSAADRAGLRRGDAILTVGGRAFPRAAARSRGSYGRVQAVEELLLASMESGPVEIEFNREGSRRSATLRPEPGCLSRVQLVPSGKLNAKADGTYAQITTAIVEQAGSDDELALVIAHEMAHNALGHRVRLDRQKASRGVLRALDGSAAKIRRTEMEADYLALYMLARAGFDLEAAPAFWQRSGPSAFLETFSDGTHPGRAERIAAALRTIQEIRLKQRQGAPLVPNLPVN